MNDGGEGGGGGRPKMLLGEYKLVGFDIRQDLLLKLDTKRGTMSRRAYIEQWLETI